MAGIQSGQHSRQRLRFQCLSCPCGNSETSRLDEVLGNEVLSWPLAHSPFGKHLKP